MNPRKDAARVDVTGVFVVEREIPEIGAQVGDRLILRPWHPTRPYGLIRPLTLGQAQWAFRLGYCRLDFTKPTMPTLSAYRRLQGDPHPPSSPRRRGHLTLLE